MNRRPPYVAPMVTSDRFPLQLASEQDRVAVLPGDWSALTFVERQRQWTLDLAGVRIEIYGLAADIGPGTAVGDALIRGWPDCVVDAVPDPDLRLSLRVVERVPMTTPVAFMATSEEAGRQLAKLRGMALMVDPDRGAGSALIEHRNPSQDVANLVRVALWSIVPIQGRVLLRAAAVELGEKALLLVGPAQAGKSTLAKLAAPRRVLTDDAVVLVVDEDSVRAVSIGLRGIEGSDGLVSSRRTVERAVAGFVSLEKAAYNRLLPVRGSLAALDLTCAVSLLRRAPGPRVEALRLVHDAISRVSVHRLQFHHRDASCWQLLDELVASEHRSAQRV